MINGKGGAMFYTYKITNTVNGKIYIGKAANIKTRWNAHKAAAKRKDANDYPYFHKALNKYGFDNFIVEQIGEYETEEQALEAEINLIDKFNSMDKTIGYNLTIGGDGASGYKFNDEQKRQMSERKKIAYVGEGNPFFGKHHSDETKKKISDIRIEQGIASGENNPFFGKTHSDETIKHLTEINTGANHPKAKYTEQDVLDIRSKFASGNFSYKELSIEYGTSPRYIRTIIERKTWKHI